MAHLTKKKLKENGWTVGAINKFLGNPDTTKPNPMFKSSAPMALYDSERVESVEKTEDFLKWKEKRDSKKDIYEKAVQTKKAKVLKEVASWSIDVPKVNNLLKKAINHYNDFKASIGDYDLYASKESDKEFLNRIMVNYIRHMLTNYDDKLDNIYGKVGVKEAYQLLNKKIYSEIGKVYPKLSQECESQFQRKFSEDNENC